MSDPVYQLALKLWSVSPKALDAEGYLSKAHGGGYTNPRAAWYADQIQAHIDATPPTLSAAMQLPEVRALVEVAQMASEHYLDMAFHREGDVLRAALAPFDDDLNAAKALQTELARVICDAVNSMFNTDCAE